MFINPQVLDVNLLLRKAATVSTPHVEVGGRAGGWERWKRGVEKYDKRVHGKICNV